MSHYFPFLICLVLVTVVLLVQPYSLCATTLTGHVVYRNDNTSAWEYQGARLDWNQAVSKHYFPYAIIFAEQVQDVVNAVLFSQENNMHLAVRSGRHSYEAYSVHGDLVLDLSRLKYRHVDPQKQMATFGAGNRLIEVYNEVMRAGMVFPGGTCPTVGISGFTLGGGYGFLGRTYGLACDNLVSLEVVTSRGDVLIANATNKYSDLFWACQGAGNGNFGIVTSLTFNLPMIQSPFIMYHLSWDSWDSIREAFNYWQKFGPSTDNRLTSQFTIYHNTFASLGQFVGSRQELEQLIAPLVNIGHPRVTLKEMTYEESVLFLSGCDSMSSCLEQAQWDPLSTSQQLWKAKSSYAIRELSWEGVEILLKYMGNHFQNVTTGFAGVLIDSMGGAINQIPSHRTAFPHRDTLFHMQFMIYWINDNDENEREGSLNWLNEFWNSLRPHVSPFSYFNYCDSDLNKNKNEFQQGNSLNYLNAYYGSNVPRLQKIKRKYDPNNVFRYTQSIPLPS